MSWVRSAFLVAQKDLRLEMRTKDILTGVGLFAVLVVVTASFAFPTWGRGREAMAAGILWVAFLFAGLLGMGRSLALEKEDDCMDALLVSPVPREGVFLGKLLANLAFTLAVEVVVIPIFIMMSQLEPARSAMLVLSVFLGTLGLVTIGTLFAAIAVNTKAHEAILPLLVMPVVVPVMIAAVKASEAALKGGGALLWTLVMVVYDALFLMVALATFPYLTEG